MKLYIETSPTVSGHAGRGIGQYTRLLVESIRQFGEIELVNSASAADVIHYPFFDLFFLTLPGHNAKPFVVTVHDVIPLLYPKAYPKGIRGTVKLALQKQRLRSAAHVVTDSEISTQDVVTHLKLSSEKVTTVYLAPDPRYKPAFPELVENVKNQLGLDKPYLLYVGDINYNKNLPGLLTAFACMKSDRLLVMVSKTLTRSNLAAVSLWKIIDSLGIESRLRILSDVPFDTLEQMRGIYSGADWYIQPSFYEGFGLPILEAQACGCPVITSTGGSLAEISKQSAIEFDPVHDDLAQVLFTTLSENRRDHFIESGFVNVKRFSWQETVMKMKVIYEKVL